MADGPKRKRASGSRRICQYKGCRSVERLCPNKKFYCFPNPRIRPFVFHQWLINSGNLQNMHQFSKSFLHKRLCSDHFKTEDYNPLSRRLKQDVAPIPLESSCNVDGKIETLFQSKNEIVPSFEKVHLAKEVNSDTIPGEVITCEIDPETLELGNLSETLNVTPEELVNFPETVNMAPEKRTFRPTFTKKKIKQKQVGAKNRKEVRIIASTPATQKAVVGPATEIALGENYKLLIYPDGKQVFSSVDSEVANKVDLHSMTSSMNRARKSGSAKKVDAQEVQGSVNVDGGPSTSTSIPQYPIPDFSASTSITQLGSPEPSTSASNTHVMLPEPSPSTSGTNDAPPEVPELFESHMYISENSMSFAEEMPASIQNKEGEVGKETATSNTCPTDKIQTPTEIMSSVKVKPLDTLQANEARSSNRTSEQNVKTANIDVSAKTLESAIRRLELVSSKLTAVSLFDSYDHFGKYVSSVLRGLPAKKVLSLKQKIISEVMQVLSQEETNSAKQGTEDSQSQNPDVGSSTKRFVAEQPQAVNLPSDPNSFALRTSVGGNVSMLYPAMYTSTPTIVAQVPFFATNIVSATSTSTLSLPDNGFITSSTPNPMVRPPLRCTKTILQCPRGRGRKRRGTPVTYSNNKRPSYETTSHTVVTPKDGTTGEEQLPKSLDEQKLQEVLKLGSRLHENSEFSERRDEEVTNEDEDLSNSQQEFEIDIEEGTELAEMKQDQQDSFETVLCEGGSDLYIKEEPPEADLTSVTATPASASSTTSAVTCNLCSERCGSREHLLAHLCSAHPGCNVAQSGYFAT